MVVKIQVEFFWVVMLCSMQCGPWMLISYCSTTQHHNSEKLYLEMGTGIELLQM